MDDPGPACYRRRSAIRLFKPEPDHNFDIQDGAQYETVIPQDLPDGRVAAAEFQTANGDIKNCCTGNVIVRESDFTRNPRVDAEMLAVDFERLSLLPVHIQSGCNGPPGWPQPVHAGEKGQIYSASCQTSSRHGGPPAEYPVPPGAEPCRCRAWNGALQSGGRNRRACQNDASCAGP